VRLDEQLPEKERINNPQDANIAAGSPIKPVDAQGAGGPNFLNRKMLEEYVTRLNAEAGVKVDVDVGRTAETGIVILEYVVTRQKAGTEPAAP
jgi:hypothetical protein